MSGLLLDTQCFLWWLAEPDRLSDEARAAIARPSTRVLVSAASAWEIAIKYGLGKLDLPEPPATFVPSRTEREGFEPLAITHEHALALGELPALHRDPFDRVLVTADDALRAYPVTVLWAAR